MNWTNIQKQFQINQQYDFFNSCGIAPPPNIVIENYKHYLNEYAQQVYLSQDYNFDIIQEQIKNHLSKLLNAPAKNFALIHTTAEGMNFVIQTLNLTAGDQVLLLEDEYPSTVYPWNYWRNKAVQIDTVSVGESQTQFLENFQLKVHQNKSLKVVCFSGCHWINGMPLPIDKISQICEKEKIFFLLDGAQVVLHQKLDLTKTNISAMAFSVWKWLLGPLGLAVLYLNDEQRNNMPCVFWGSSSVEKSQQYFPYKSDQQKSINRFSYSTPNFNDWVYFSHSLNFLNDIGFEKVQNRLYQLAQYAKIKLQKLDAIFGYENDQGYESAIVTVRFKKYSLTKATSAEKISQYLASKNVIAMNRGNFIRLGFHIFNSETQIDNVVRILAQYLKQE